MGRYYALILGASSGFGKEISLELAGDGVGIIGVHLDRATTKPDVDKLIEDIRSKGAEAHFFNINAADPVKRAEVIQEVRKILDNAGGDASIRVIVHSLAFGTLKPLIGDTRENSANQKQIEMTLDVMANSLVYWTQDVILEGMMKEGGKVYGMTSSGGSRQIEFYGVVSAAKACLESYVRQLSMELGSRGISVNAIRAGVTDTPALRKIPNAEKIIANALQRNPSKTLTKPSEIARYILDNYKNDSHWLTGNVICLDGGESVVEL